MLGQSGGAGSIEETGVEMAGNDRVNPDAIATDSISMAQQDENRQGLAGRPVAAVRTWLVDEVASLVRVSPDEIDVHQPFVHYGIGSAQGLELAAKLEDWIGFPLSPTLIWDYPSIESLAQHLAEQPARAATAETREDR
jgi:acyl carrier protein